MSSVPALAAPAVAPVLDTKQKAAVILGLLEGQGLAPPPEAFDPALRAELDAARAGLGTLPDATVAAVVDEFLVVLRGGTTPLPASPSTPAPTPLPDLPDLAPLPAMGDPLPDLGLPLDDPSPADEDPWERIAAQDDAWLTGVLQREAPEVAAVVLTQLKVSRGAELLGQTPGPQARAIAYAVSQIGSMTPETLTLIGTALAGTLGSGPKRAFNDGPVERLGALLNSARAATRDDVLAALDEDDPEFAEAVRKSIFTFANIPARIDPRDMPKIVRKLDQDALVRALKAAEAEERHRASAEFILNALSQRMSETIRTEIEESEPIKEPDGEAAMAEVVAVIREMDAAGEIYFLAEED